MKEPIKLNPPYDLEETRKMLRTNDDLGLVLRMYFLVERCLIKKTISVLPKADQIYGNGLNIRICCELLRMLSVPDFIWQYSDKLRKIRNKFAHGAANQIDQKMCNELRSLMHANARKALTGGKVILVGDDDAESQAVGHLQWRLLFVAMGMIHQTYIMTLHGNWCVSSALSGDNSHSSNWSHANLFVD